MLAARTRVQVDRCPLLIIYPPRLLALRASQSVCKAQQLDILRTTGFGIVLSHKSAEITGKIKTMRNFFLAHGFLLKYSVLTLLVVNQCQGHIVQKESAFDELIY